jgi:hypothetical protein
LAVTGIAVREVELTTGDVARPRFTPRELRLIKEQVGRSFTQVMSDEESDDRFVVFAWLKLRRDGHQLDWSDMDDVLITISSDQPPDPTNGQPATTSPRSAATGA